MPETRNLQMPRVALVAEHASSKFGGEAALPLHIFRVLLKKNVPVILITHARVRAELELLFPNSLANVHFIKDSWFNKLMWRLGSFLPNRISYFTTGWLSRLATQLQAKQILRNAIERGVVDIIHQPIPVSPKEPSLIYGLDVPVVIGPMNGGIDYPDAFKKLQHRWISSLIATGRFLSALFNNLMRGKKLAAVLLVANSRTEQALPQGCKGRILNLVENGVDLDLWKPPVVHSREPAMTCNFVFMGRLVDWKAVDLLLDAFAKCSNRNKCTLTIVGDGSEGARLKNHADELGILNSLGHQVAGKVRFLGWLPQVECSLILAESDSLVLPSLMECGGAVVLEAMSVALPVIATNWGGPVDYLDDTCGILVSPSSRSEFVNGLSTAMDRLAASQSLRISMGAAGRTKVIELFDWDKKVDQMLDIYRETIAERKRA